MKLQTIFKVTLTSPVIGTSNMVATCELFRVKWNVVILPPRRSFASKSCSDDRMRLWHELDSGFGPHDRNWQARARLVHAPQSLSRVGMGSVKWNCVSKPFICLKCRFGFHETWTTHRFTRTRIQVGAPWDAGAHRNYAEERFRLLCLERAGMPSFMFYIPPVTIAIKYWKARGFWETNPYLIADCCQTRLHRKLEVYHASIIGVNFTNKLSRHPWRQTGSHELQADFHRCRILPLNPCSCPASTWGGWAARNALDAGECRVAWNPAGALERGQLSEQWLLNFWFVYD